MAITRKDAFSNFIRGGDTLSHRMQLFVKNLFRTALILAFAFFAIWYFTLQAIATPMQKEVIFYNRMAAAAKMLFMGRVIKLEETIHDDSGSVVIAKKHVPAGEVFSDTALAYAEFGSPVVWRAALLALLITLGLGFAGVVMQIRFGKKIATDEFLRGAKIVSGAKLAELVKEAGASDFKLGGVPIPLKALTRNILLAGAMGSGKSQDIANLIDVAMAKTMKLIIYDLSGETIEQRCDERNPNHVILNFADARCANWVVFNDLQNRYDFYQFASYFVPKPKGSQDPFWANSASQLLADVFQMVNSGREGEKSMQNVHRIAVTIPLKDLAEKLRSYSLGSQGTIHEKSGATAGSIRSTLAEAIKFFPLLPPLREDIPSFSIRKFVSEMPQGSILFMSSREDLQEVSLPFIKAWTEIALKERMTGEIGHDGEPDLLLALDEIATLGELSSLKHVLTRGRKYRILVIGGAQDLAQFDEEHGEAAAKTMIGNFRNKLVLATDENSSAKRLADLLGFEDVDEKEEGTSYGVESNRDGLNISGKRGERHIVTATEISQLADMEGYLRLAGNLPRAKVQVPFKKRPKIAQGFILRDDLRIKDFPSTGDAKDEQGDDSPDDEASGGRAIESAAQERQANNQLLPDDIPEIPNAMDVSSAEPEFDAFSYSPGREQ